MFKKRSGVLTGLGLLAFLSTACVVANTDDDKDQDDKVEPSPSDQDAGAGDTDAGGEDSDPNGDTDAEFPDDYTEDCGETGQNDTRETAVGFGKNVQICVEEGDEDWLKVTVPATGGAYLLEVGYQQANDARFAVSLFAGEDNSRIWEDQSAKGTSGSFAVTVGAGTTTYVQFKPYFGNGLVNLTLDVTPENDPYEPNNVRDDAAEVNVNEDIKGQHWIPYVSASDQNADDWFKVDLAAGQATLKLTQMPENLRFELQVVGPTFNNIGTSQSPNAGALHTWDFNVTEAGTHYIRVSNYFSNKRGPKFWNEKPKSLTEQYTLRIEQ